MSDATITDPAKKLGELFSVAEAAGAKLHELRTLPADRRGTAYADDLRAAQTETEIADAAYARAERNANHEMHQAVLKLLAEQAQRSAQGNGPTAATGSMGQREARTLGERFTSEQGYKEWAESRSTGQYGAEVRADFPPISEGGDLTTGPGLWIPRGTPFLPSQAIDRMRLFVRDLVAGGTTTLTAIPYIRENSPDPLTPSGANVVAEGTQKPNVTMNFEPDTALVQKIAAWLSATYEILQDAPTLRSYIDARLSYMLQVREEQQILHGTGTTPQLKGILTFTDNQTLTDEADPLIAAATAAGMIELKDGVADGLVMNPGDFWAIISKRGSDGHFDVNPFQTASQSLWGFTTVRTRSVTAGTMSVGAWRMGAQIFDRESATLRVGDQHLDYFTTNKVAILIEERLTVATYRPDWFVNVSGLSVS